MSQPQHMLALERANEIRLARARLKRDLRARRVSLREALEKDFVESMPVFDLLVTQRQWGTAKARKALQSTAVLLGMAVPLSQARTVGSLTDRQKQALLQACGYGTERKAAA